MNSFKAILLFILMFATAAVAEEEAVQRAELAAVSWLGLIDEGEYAQSWREAASLFQLQLGEEEWVDAATAARLPLGLLTSREFEDARYSTTMAGGPDGHYVVLMFASGYENKASATETVTAMVDDGEWRVVGYYIR